MTGSLSPVAPPVAIFPADVKRWCPPNTRALDGGCLDCYDWVMAIPGTLSACGNWRMAYLSVPHSRNMRKRIRDWAKRWGITLDPVDGGFVINTDLTLVWIPEYIYYRRLAPARHPRAIGGGLNLIPCSEPLNPTRALTECAFLTWVGGRRTLKLPVVSADAFAAFPDG
jgi:hypothetical protein